MATLGGGKVNIHPCTEAEERQNWSTVQNFITEITNNGLVDAFTVGMNSSDVTPTYAGPDFLFNKILNQSTFDAEVHQLVYGEVYDDSGVLKLNLFTASGTGGGVDDHKVLVSDTDSTAEYLFDSMKDQDAFDPSTDYLVYAFVEDAEANEKLRLFVRVDSSFADSVFNSITVVGGSYAGGVLTLAGSNPYPTAISLDTTGNSLRVTLTLSDSSEITGAIEVKDILDALVGYVSGQYQSIVHDRYESSKWNEDTICT